MLSAISDRERTPPERIQYEYFYTRGGGGGGDEDIITILLSSCTPPAGLFSPRKRRRREDFDGGGGGGTRSAAAGTLKAPPPPRRRRQRFPRFLSLTLSLSLYVSISFRFVACRRRVESRRGPRVTSRAQLVKNKTRSVRRHTTYGYRVFRSSDAVRCDKKRTWLKTKKISYFFNFFYLHAAVSLMTN